MPLPTNALELLVDAIATQEGDHTRHNPGNLRYAGQKNATTPGWDGKGPSPLAVFIGDRFGTADEYGRLAAYRDILAKAAEGLTIRQIIQTYCPSGDGFNNPTEYLAHIHQWTGLPLDTPVLQLLPNLIPLNQV